MRSKILAALSALAIALGMVAFTTMSASAHTPTINATCTTLSVSLTNYNNHANKANTVTVTIDGSVVDSDSDFGASFVKSYTFSDKTVAHTWKVDYTAWDDANGHNGWTGSKSGTTTPCAAKDATAAISFTPPTCDTPQGLVLGATTNATWGAITYSGAGNLNFSVTATAVGNHLFKDTSDKTGKTKTFTGTLLAATGNCAPPPCLDKSAVSYTYDATTNSGVITVAAKSGYSNTLCKPFWVVAASWKFIGNTMWPQQLHQWNPATGDNLNASNGSIDKVGVYYYAANVDCGQGDIYATFNSPGVPTVPAPQILTASKTPYPEHFLHQMGFSGPNPTYTVQDAGACNAVSAGVAFQGYECNVFGPLVLSGTHVTFTVKYDDAPGGQVSGVVPGSYELLADFAAQTGARYFGQVTVTVQADPGYTLLSVGTPVPLTAGTAVPSSVKMDPTMQTEWVLAANEPQDCPTVIDIVPEVTFTDVCGTTNDTINVPSQTGVTYATVDDRVNGVGDVTVTATPSSTDYVFADTVTKTSWTFTFTNESCGEIKYLEPSAVDPTCPEEPDATSGYILLDLKDHLHYTIDGISTNQAKNDRLPGTYTIGVTVDSGYTLVGPSSWTLVVNEPFCPPTLALLSTTASMSNLTCSAAGSFTLADTEGIEWFVNGSTTATPAGTYTRSTPGVVNVEAKLVDPVNDGWELDAQKTWTFTFTSPVDCLPTLAFTGSNGGNLGLLLSGGLLLFGGTIIAFERRFRNQTR